jgi:hypothetical protein
MVMNVSKVTMMVAMDITAQLKRPSPWRPGWLFLWWPWSSLPSSRGHHHVGQVDYFYVVYGQHCPAKETLTIDNDCCQLGKFCVMVIKN